MKDPFDIEVRNPFPTTWLPAMWKWTQKFWDKVATDSTPTDEDAWIEKQLERINNLKLISWGVYRSGELGGYVEMLPHVVLAQSSDQAGTVRLSTQLDCICEVHTIFKQEFWGRRTTIPALNQCASQIFSFGFEIILAPVFEHNNAIRALLRVLGAKEAGPLLQPITQGGEPVQVILYTLLRSDWARTNSEFLESYQQQQNVEGREERQPEPVFDLAPAPSG
jgi:RimJ/RimL family protein N-acetyltransferase